MRTTDKIFLNYILQHKEHFDQKLIAIVENLKSHNGKLIEEREYLRHQYHNQKLTISQLHLKKRIWIIKNMKSIKNILIPKKTRMKFWASK